MNPLPLLLFPLAEIAGFILVGRAIGLIPTLALIVASTVIGVVLLRDAGLATLLKLQRGTEAPDRILSEGGTKMLAGLLLLIPGFLTDLAALALLVPALRKRMVRAFGTARVAAPVRSGPPGSTASGAPVIEGDFRRLDR